MQLEEVHYRQSDLSIGLISDSHGSVDQRIVEAVRDCDIVLHAGDVMVPDSLDELRRSSIVHAVAGNNDSTGPDGLPQVLRVHLAHGEIVVEHGHRFGFHEPDLDELANTHSQARVIVYGHTHELLLQQDRRPWILNPGACGQTRNNGGPKCLLLAVQGGDWTVQKRMFPNA